MGTNQFKWHEQTKFGVHLLVVIFGTTSWSIMNGLWVELPILVTYLPEGWTLPSYLTIISQFGFLGLLAFILVSYLTPRVKLETPASFVIVSALTLCALLYSFFWTETGYINGTEYSVALLGLTFSQAIFASMTSIAYVTFMAHLKARYMASIFVGMGLSGLIPALAASGQGMGSIKCVDLANLTGRFGGPNGTQGLMTGSGNSFDAGVNVTVMNWTTIEVRDWHIAANEEPGFSIQGFFLLLFGVGVLSLLSLVMLVYHPYCKSEHVDTDKEENSQLTKKSRKQDTQSQVAENRDGIKLKLRSKTSNNSMKGTADRLSTIPTIEITGASEKSNNTIANSDLQSPLQGAMTDVLSNSYESSPSSGENGNNDRISYRRTSSENNDKKPSVLLRGESKVDDSNSSVDDSNGFVDDSNGSVDGVDTTENEEDVEAKVVHPNKGKQLSKLESWYLLALLVWINALQTSFVLAIQVYSSLPYGIQFYHAATKAENIVDPIASLLTFWISANTTRTITGLTFLGTLFTAYIVTVASMSPNPFLVHETAGGILVVTAWVMCTILMVFSKVSIANVMRGQGRMSLMWTGGSTQFGALLGAALAYLLINHLHLFKDEPWCR